MKYIHILKSLSKQVKMKNIGENWSKGVKKGHNGSTVVFNQVNWVKMLNQSKWVSWVNIGKLGLKQLTVVNMD